MDASINVSMEPFRAFVGDMLPRKQRAMGYAMQSFFIGVASVVASSLPWMMTNWFNISNVAEPGMVPDTVKFAFYAGGVVFFLAVLWTIYSTKEYSPDELKAFQEAEDKDYIEEDFIVRSAQKYLTGGLIWLVVGIVSFALVALNIEQLDQNLFILAGGFCFFGICQLVASLMAKNNSKNGFAQVMSDLFSMPQTMKQLAFVQFFSWFAFFTMWSLANPALTEHVFKTPAPIAIEYDMAITAQAEAFNIANTAFQESSNLVGSAMGVYGLSSMAFALILVLYTSKRRINRKLVHMFSLMLGGVGFLLMYYASPENLKYCFVLIGFAWGSILSMPYAMLSSSVDPKKMGVIMGIFNMFIVIPQIIAALGGINFVAGLLGDEAINAMTVAGISLIIAGFTNLLITNKNAITYQTNE